MLKFALSPANLQANYKRAHSWDSTIARAGRGGGTSSLEAKGMCRWMGSHFHDWVDYHGVAFSIELLEWGRRF